MVEINFPDKQGGESGCMNLLRNISTLEVILGQSLIKLCQSILKLVMPAGMRGQTLIRLWRLDSSTNLSGTDFCIYPQVRQDSLP